MEIKSLNNQVAWYDKDLNILQSIDNDPAFILHLPNDAVVGIVIEMYSSIDDIAVVYFKDRDGEVFTEGRTIRNKVKKGCNMLTVDFPHVKPAKEIRFDPMRSDGIFCIQSISFKRLL